MSAWLSYLLQEFQRQSGHLVCHRGIQHLRTIGEGTLRAPPFLVVSYLQESTAQLPREKQPQPWCC